MEASIFLVADYANITHDQKLNVMGIFSNIAALEFPVTHPELFVVTQLSARASEFGRKFRVGISLIDEDGQVMVNFEANAEVPHAPATSVNMPHILRLLNTIFPKPGTYELSLLVDGDVKATLPVEVVKIQMPPAENGPTP